MRLIALSRLLTEGRRHDHPVAVRNGQVIDFGRFKIDVASAVTHFQDCRSAALICEDSYNFAVGLLGLLHAGAKIIFPPNGLSASLQTFRQEFDIIADDAHIENRTRTGAILTPIDPTLLSLSFFTSGSTGNPKKILKSLAMLESEIATLDSLWERDRGPGTVFATVSHQHIYGLTFRLLWPLSAGRPFSTKTHALWEDLLGVLPAHAVIVSSPAHLGRLEGIEPLVGDLIPERIFCAGAPLSLDASLQSEIILGCTPTEIFGSTETGAFATRSRVNGNEAWQFLPGIEMRRDPHGLLVLRSPFLGDDWITTADLVEPLHDGFRFLGRADSIVKIEGQRVSLLEIEHALAKLSLVKSAAVVVLSGETNCLAAAIALSEEGRSAIADIGRFRLGRLLKSQLAVTLENAGIPRVWRFVDELPTHDLGKQSSIDILALFGEGL